MLAGIIGIRAIPVSPSSNLRLPDSNDLPKRFIPAIFVVLWATGFIGARYAMPWAEPFTFLAARFVLAFVILAVAAAVLGSRGTGWRDALHAAAAGALMHGVYLGGVFWAIHHGMPAGLSALIVGLQPLITAVLAGSLLGEKILPRHWAGLAAGFAGVVIVLLPKLGALGSGVNAATLAASFVAVAGMSAGTIWQKRFLTGGDLVAGTCSQYAAARSSWSWPRLPSRHASSRSPANSSSPWPGWCWCCRSARSSC